MLFFITRLVVAAAAVILIDADAAVATAVATVAVIALAVVTVTTATATARERERERERETQTQTQMVYCLQVLKTFNNFAAYNRIYIYIREIDNNYKHGKQTTRLEQLYTRYNIQNTR